MDIYMCDKCKRIFDEFEMDFKFAQEEGVTLCPKCKEEYQCKAELLKEYLKKQAKRILKDHHA